MEKVDGWVQPLVRRDMRLNALVREHGFARCVCSFLYYSIVTRLPDTPMPGCRFGNWMRRTLAKRMLKRFGRGSRIHARVRFSSGADLELGNNCRLSRGTWILGPVVMGDDVQIAADVTIIAYNQGHDVGKPVGQQGSLPPAPVVIGDDVWIGTRAIILPGVRVGNHTIVGAGAVVTKNVADWTIVAGNPAKLIRDRRHSKKDP